MTPALRRTLLFILLFIGSLVMPAPRQVPSAWFTAYTATISLGLVSLMATIAMGKLLRPAPPDLTGLWWVGSTILFGLAWFPSIPHAGSFWITLPWTRGAFWWGEIGTLTGMAGFFGLIWQGTAWIRKHFHR